MAALSLEIAKDNFHCFRCKRLQQGEVWAGGEPMATLLGSCVYVGFYDARRRLGAMSHITGFGAGAGHDPEGALRLLEQRMERLGVPLGDCECFLVGGSELSRTPFDRTVHELKRRGLSYQSFDTLGHWHRKLMLDPARGVVTLYRKEGRGEPESKAAGPSGDSIFQDPVKRVTTGASMMFRNARMLDLARDVVAPGALAMGGRLHVWCAGCSTGMEVYSVAMVLLDAAERLGGGLEVMALGSDISRRALEVARAGVYPVSERAVAGRAALLRRYAAYDGQRRVTMGPELRKVVVFKERRIEDGSRRHEFEFVVCDHVLQYYSAGEQMRLLDSLTRAVRSGGWMFVSTPTISVREAIPKRFPFEELERHFYRKAHGFPTGPAGPMRPMGQAPVSA